MKMFFWNFLGTLWGLFVPLAVYRVARRNARLMAVLDVIDVTICEGCEANTPEDHPWADGPMFNRPSYYLRKLGL